MGIMNVKDVAGIYGEEGEVVCRSCIQDHEWQRQDRYEVILKTEVAKRESIYFCDRCGEKLSSV